MRFGVATQIPIGIIRNSRAAVVRGSFESGPIAQLVEQLTLNQRVAGSIPARLTTISIAESHQTGGFSSLGADPMGTCWIPRLPRIIIVSPSALVNESEVRN